MRRVVLKTMIAGGLFAATAIQIQAAAPAAAQGTITMRTYPGDQRDAARDGTAAEDGVFFPLRMEGPYNNFPDADPGDDTIVPVDERDTYTTELVGYFYPPKTGKIQFAFSTDDPGSLYFSTDDNPANKVKIANEPTWNGKRSFASEARRTRVNNGTLPADRLENQSAWIDVTAAKPYFIQSISYEGGGGDNNAVAFRYEGDAEFADGDLPIGGSLLSTIDRPDLSVPFPSGFKGTPSDVTFSISDGTGAGAKQLDPASVKVTVNGAAKASTVKKNGTVSTVTAVISPYFAPGSKNTAKVEYTGGSSEKSFTISNYKTLTPDMKVTPGTQTGFSLLTYKVDVALPNTISAAEQVLAGVYKDAAGDVLPNVADLSGAGTDGRFNVDLINFADAATDNQGNFRSDDAHPVPGIDAGDNYAQEILTFLELPAGAITMGVNSDDGFQTTAGNIKDVLARAVLGEFNGGRGAADTIFDFAVQEAGVYAFRTIWFEGGGDSNAEWFTVNNGTKVLLNDTANGGYKAFRTATSAKPVYVKLVTPPPPPPAASVKSVISAVLVDQEATVDQASIKMTVNGQAVTPTISKAGVETTVAHTPSADLPANANVSVVVSFKDNNGVSRDAAWSFPTEILISAFGADALFIEAEDFNYENGKFLTTAGQSGFGGKYAGGLYLDLGSDADSGIDYFNAGGNAAQTYRSTTGVAAGKMNAHPDGLPRGTFDVEVNHVVGWNDAGDWQNYTRNFPTPAKKYDVYARMSSGGLAINQEISKVTSDPTKPNQTVQHLGQIRPGRATAGWDNLEIFRAIDDAGDPLVLELGGATTLRLTTVPGSNLDIDWLGFIPSKDTGGTVGKFTAISSSGGNVTITWSGAGTLQKASAVTGPWADVTGAASPSTQPASGEGGYYRLRQ